MTVRRAARIWFWWLAFVAASFAVIEVAMIFDAWIAGQAIVQVFTLSDTIRRWSLAHRWLMPIVTGTTTFLLCHFFYERNR